MTIYFDQKDADVNSKSSPLGIVDIPKRGGLYRDLFKRLFEGAVVIVVLPIAVPIIFVLALLAGRDGHNPFYLSDRVGRGGKNFRMFKLRTMVPNAEELLEAHLATNADAREEWESTQKLKDDPRITSIGRFLRKSSLDELPQLWNVMVGNMSLVGPRPMLPSQRALYPGLAYYALRPGITGLWQVSDRNDVEFARRADFDREYYVQMSFFMDIRLMVKTVAVVIRGTGY